MKTDTTIHHTELLLTLDYLLHHSDESHPATQLAICRHAKEYGLKYDEKNLQGNDVKRQRITKCLQFLEEVCDKHADKVPFILQKTDSGKYYVEQRNGLDEDQIGKVLALIMDDKYAKGEDSKHLIDALLDAFASSEGKKKEILNIAKLHSRGGRKADKETLRRIDLIEKAYREGKMIWIEAITKSAIRSREAGYYRVCRIKNIQNEPWAFLLPVKEDKRLTTVHNYLFRPIKAIPVAKTNNVLMEDLDPHRNLNELFKRTNPRLSQRYCSLDDMLEQLLCPEDGKAIMASFYFELRRAKTIASSFESFFSEKLQYQECSEADINAITGFGSDMGEGFDSWDIVILDKPQEPFYGLATVSVDSNAFLSWLLSGGLHPIASLIEDIIKPKSLKEEIAGFYARQTFNAYSRVTDVDYKKLDTLTRALRAIAPDNKEQE